MRPFGIKKRKAPVFPETSHPFSIVSCQLSPQVFFQIVKPHRLYFRQHFFQYSALLNTPPETVPLDRTNGALRPLKWCMVTAVMVH